MFTSISLRDIGVHAFLLLGLIAPPPIWAQTAVVRDSIPRTLTLTEARALASRENPLLLAARQRPLAAAGELRQTQTFRFNPDLTATGSRNPEVALMQELEVGGKRGLRVKVASEGLLGARFVTAEVGRALMTDVGKTFYRVMASERRKQVVEQLGLLGERLIEAVRIQLREGEISMLDANLAEIELGRVRARAATIRREAVAHEFELKRLLGLPPSAVLQLIDDSSDVGLAGVPSDSLTQSALRQRPDLQAATAELAASRSSASLARREMIPNLRTGVVAERGAGIGIAFGISLPFLNRNRGTIEARDADVRRAEFNRIATENQIRSDIASAVAVLMVATEEHRLFSESVLRPARASAQMLEQSYREGKIPLTTLLLLRNQLLDAEIGYWDAWLARREALVDLDAATGLLVPAIDQPDRVPPARNPQDLR